ncbi:hypothetical protein ACFOTA_07930 [Chitinophaga sp. GCM10012297]|uniref:Uncharacterized protein n=1 Tax=Chitinophaga chungangae TaxID=2821488 RepID=A0ABS3YBS6_9BACT|nr:hypothetical protein [Chitinophaga chungangae]MBO9152132.1 hypothetical protein [Chitinophaga chungangae]
MGTWLNIFIRHNDHRQVADALQEFSEVSEVRQGNTSDVLKCSSLILHGEDTPPSFLVSEDMQNGWIRVHLNSFAKLPGWLEKLSDRLQTSVLQVIGQTTSDYYYLLLYENGRFKRELEGIRDEPEKYIDRGEMLPFEEPFVPGLDEYECEKVRLNGDDVDDFCKGLGFDFWSDFEYEGREFYLLKKDIIGLTMDEYLDQKKYKRAVVREPTAAAKSRPWWKFWQR